MTKIKGEGGYKFIAPITRFLFKLYYHPKFYEKKLIPKEGPIIIVCNHKHIMDQCMTICATKRPIHYLAKKEYFDGHFAWFFKLGGCISVDRQNGAKDATEKAINYLNQGSAVGLFPEGTRNRTTDTKLLPLKFGAVSMAKKTGATIVPCCVTGDYKFRSKNLVVKYGKPFKVSDDLEAANEYLAETIVSLMDDCLKMTNRTWDEELASHFHDKKEQKKEETKEEKKEEK